MKALLIGGGGREHAIADAIVKSGINLYAVMKNRNPGISRLCKEFLVINETDVNAVVEYATKKAVDFAIVGPEAPLAEGIADAMGDKGIPCIGPTRKAARLEWDKAWARRFMKEHKIDGYPDFGVFDNVEEAIQFASELGDFVIKPSGLTGGKGVKVMGEHFNSVDEARKLMEDVVKSHKIVVEERLIGEEFTIQALVDGKTIVEFPCVQDHKRAFEGDTGPNTGGMGSYSDRDHLLPFLDKTDVEEALEIMGDTITHMNKEGIEYRGILYGQFMATSNGVKLIEYNVRFGDPEAMNVLPILESDFGELCMDVLQGTLKGAKFMKVATVCKYLVPAGYPENPMTGTKIDVPVEDSELLKVFFASVYEEDGSIYTTSSRALALVGLGESIYEAEERVEKAISLIKGNLFYRKDIGKKHLVERRVKHMKELRSGI